MQSKKDTKVADMPKKPLPICFVFSNIFSHIRHFSEYYANPVKKLEELECTLFDENKCFKSYKGSRNTAGYAYICLVETDIQDYIVLCSSWREYVTFSRNFAMLPREMFEKLVPATL